MSKVVDYLDLDLVLLHQRDHVLAHHLCLPHLLPLLQVRLKRGQGLVFLHVELLEQQGSDGQDDLVVVKIIIMVMMMMMMMMMTW